MSNHIKQFMEVVDKCEDLEELVMHFGDMRAKVEQQKSKFAHRQKLSKNAVETKETILKSANPDNQPNKAEKASSTQVSFTNCPSSVFNGK